MNKTKTSALGATCENGIVTLGFGLSSMFGAHLHALLPPTMTVAEARELAARLWDIENCSGEAARGILAHYIQDLESILPPVLH